MASFPHFLPVHSVRVVVHEDEGPSRCYWLPFCSSAAKVCSPTGIRSINCGVLNQLESCHPPGGRLPSVQGVSLHTVWQCRSHFSKLAIWQKFYPSPVSPWWCFPMFCRTPLKCKAQKQDTSSVAQRMRSYVKRKLGLTYSGCLHPQPSILYTRKQPIASQCVFTVLGS